MSIVEEVGALVRAAADELPLELLSRALDRFNHASERLRWVRQESADPMGVPELSVATEHVEGAGHALRVAQEQLAGYLAAIGLAADGEAGPPPAPRQRDPRAEQDPEQRPQPGAATERGPAPAVHRWWPERVDELTGQDRAGGDEPPPAERPAGRATDPQELLRRVAVGVRAGDRGRLHTELRQVDTDVGLGLAAIAPPLVRQLATELVGRPPRAQDLPRLRRELDGGVRSLLPGLPPAVYDTLLTRVCRMPPPKEPAEQPHPADPAVAASVLAGLLLQRLGHDGPPKDTGPAPAVPGPTPHRETHG